MTVNYNCLTRQLFLLSEFSCIFQLHILIRLQVLVILVMCVCVCVCHMGERRGAYRALVGKSEGRRPLGRPRRRWEDNIKMDLREVWWGGCRLDWSGSG
jgi:hypothetical protein